MSQHIVRSHEQRLPFDVILEIGRYICLRRDFLYLIQTCRLLHNHGIRLLLSLFDIEFTDWDGIESFAMFKDTLSVETASHIRSIAVNFCDPKIANGVEALPIETFAKTIQSLTNLESFSIHIPQPVFNHTSKIFNALSGHPSLAALYLYNYDFDTSTSGAMATCHLPALQEVHATTDVGPRRADSYLLSRMLLLNRDTLQYISTSWHAFDFDFSDIASSSIQASYPAVTDLRLHLYSLEANILGDFASIARVLPNLRVLDLTYMFSHNLIEQIRGLDHADLDYDPPEFIVDQWREKALGHSIKPMWSILERVSGALLDLYASALRCRVKTLVVDYVEEMTAQYASFLQTVLQATRPSELSLRFHTFRLAASQPRGEFYAMLALSRDYGLTELEASFEAETPGCLQRLVEFFSTQCVELPDLQTIEFTVCASQEEPASPLPDHEITANDAEYETFILSNEDIQRVVRDIEAVLPNECMPNLKHVEFVYQGKSHKVQVQERPYVTRVRHWSS